MTLEEYIEAEIIPGYRAFDAAHREDHVRNVIAQSQELAKSYDVNPKMLYAAAAYHDTGLSEGRERHHLVSGKIIRDDKMLHNWFSDDEIEIIAEAAEDHRASNANPPRSIYGRIIAESDRLIDPDTVIRRTVLYGFDHYPEMNRRQMWERTLSHLEEKYGEGGYLKLWIPESPNAERLAELRRLIADKDRLRRMFDEIYRHEKYVPSVCERFINDEKYRKWHINVIAPKPGTIVLGLHKAEMKAFAKEIVTRDDWRDILSDMSETYKYSPYSHDERTIWGLAIDYAKCGIEERLRLTDEFIPSIDNWAICDTFCCNAKWVLKEADRSIAWSYILRKVKSKKEFIRRTGIVLMLRGFLTREYISSCFQTLTSMNLAEGEPYYVRMAIAWLLATALAKFPDETIRFVRESRLPSDIISLYVRKAHESFRTKDISAL